MQILLKNIQSLLSVYNDPPSRLSGKEMDVLPKIDNAWLLCREGKIESYGGMDSFPGVEDWNGLEVIDCAGKIVMPAFCDSHTHIVYSGSREGEFADRIKGLSYQQIAERGGGILNSVAKLRKTSEDELFESAHQRLREIISQGTGAVEIKSGYGLDVENELKMLRVIRRLKELELIPVKATFLGAHAIPPEYKNNKEGYIQLIEKEMIPGIIKENLADFIDVFCEKGYFTPEETKRILCFGEDHSIRGKIHAEQLSHSGGIKAGVGCDAISVDHLEYCSEEDMDALSGSRTMPTILPGAAFFLGLPHPPARKMIDSGLPLAIASDYNPGSSPSGNMKLMMSIACIQYRMTPTEALNAATINSAYAMDMHERCGTITAGKDANLIITKRISGVDFIPYAFGSDLVERVIVGGKVIT